MSVVLRLAGAALTVACGAALGALVAQRHRRRPRELAAVRTALQVLLTEIDVGLTPLPQALERAGDAVEGPVRRLFAGGAALLRQGRGLTGGEAWLQALTAAAPDLALDDEDLDILAALGPCLGRTDRRDQRRHLQLAAARLEAAERQARDGWRDRYRLSLYLGTLGAALLAIVML